MSNTSINPNRILKIFLLLQILFFLRKCSLTKTEEDFIFQEYDKRRGKYPFTFNDLTRDFFDIWFQSDIFSRVSNVKKYLSHGSGGFVFTCNYKMPVSKEIVPAALKFLPDNDGDGSFEKNSVLAVLTGTFDEDRFRPGMQRPYSKDDSKDIIQINMGIEKDPNSLYINQFYEMQWIPAQIEEVIENVTVLVTALGLQDLKSPMFHGQFDKGKDQNTEEFLRIYKEYCIGAKNINSKGILHGDHKPENIILEIDSENVRHPAIIDFDLRATWTEDFDNYNSQLRYTHQYRAPSIESLSQIEGVEEINEETKQPQVVDYPFYFFSSDLREDTYAVGILFSYIYIHNINKINGADKRVINIKTLVRLLMKKEPFSLLRVPTTDIWVDMVTQIINAGDSGNQLVEQFAAQTFPLDSSNLPQGKKFLLI